MEISLDADALIKEQWRYRKDAGKKFMNRPRFLKFSGKFSSDWFLIHENSQIGERFLPPPARLNPPFSVQEFHTYGSILSSIDFNISLAANTQCFSKHGISGKEKGWLVVTSTHLTAKIRDFPGSLTQIRMLLDVKNSGLSFNFLQRHNGEDGAQYQQHQNCYQKIFLQFAATVPQWGKDVLQD